MIEAILKLLHVTRLGIKNSSSAGGIKLLSTGSLIRYSNKAEEGQWGCDPSKEEFPPSFTTGSVSTQQLLWPTANEACKRLLVGLSKGLVMELP